MRLEAPSAAALLVEAARGVSEVIRGRPLEPRAGWDEEVSIAAPDAARLLVAWIAELVRRSVRSRVRFEQFEIVYVSDRRLVAWIHGVRLGDVPAPPSPVPTYHDPSLVQRPGHLTATPVLDL